MIWLLRLVLLLAPVVLFGWLLRQKKRRGEARLPLKAWYLLAGCLLLVFGGLVLSALLQPSTEGQYIPAHMKDGRLVPAQLR